MDISDVNASTKPPTGRRMKGRAPPPPPAPQPAPRRIFTTRNAVPDGGGQGSDDTKENVLRPSVDLLITLPGGFQTSSTVDGSKALMDLLVDLCSQHHLNPAHHTLELLSPNVQPLAFKPNTPLGALDVHHVCIREKVAEDKVVRKPLPKVPEKTVRLVVNYHRTQKAVVRVNPLVPLESLVPVICEKCEFDPAYVLLLQDNVSNHELDLGRSLSEHGIRELYALDQNLVLQPKMASAPALNYSESNRHHTSSVGESEKRGLLGLFKFNRRKTKTEEHTSVDMEATADKTVDSSESCSNGVPAAPCRPFVEVRPSTLGQSQSVMNISRMSPKVEVKKRRAPPPPQAQSILCQAPGSVESFQVSSSSPNSSLQKKRKAPAPPLTPVPSIPAEDTASELSHSTEDSEAGGSICSSSSSSCMEAAELAPSTTPEEGGPPPSTTPEAESARSTTPEVEPAARSTAQVEPTVRSTAQVEPTARSKPQVEPTARSKPQAEPARSATPEETESVLNLKLEEMENNRHSTMGSGRQVPLKPRRAPPRDPPQLEIPPPPTYAPPPTDQESHHAQPEAAQSWLHSLQVCASDQASEVEPEVEPEPEPEVALEAETVSLDSGSSCPDQGYAASEGMAEDSGIVSSPSDLAHPASPDDSISLGQGSAHTRAGTKDCSSDSDEGCATWGSRHRHSVDIYHKSLSGKRQDSYEEDPELTAQLHQTLAELEADLADVDHTERASVSELSVSSMDRSPHSELSVSSVDRSPHSEIPVSVVDCEVPVTTIDEVFEDYQHSMTAYEAALLCSTQTSNSANQSCPYQPSGQTKNKNNNARTSDGQGKAGKTPAGEARGHSLPEEALGRSSKQEERSAVTQAMDTRASLQRESFKEDAVPGGTQTPVQNIPGGSALMRKESVERPGKGEPAASTRWQVPPSKITRSTTSRFGMKTFTIVPPKPVLVHNQKTGSLATGAIKIDAQGNMVKNETSEIYYSRPPGSGSDSDAPLLGKAKAFWSSTEQQDIATTSKGHAPKTRDPEISRAPPAEPPAEDVGKTSPVTTLGEVVEGAMHQLAKKKPASQEPIRQPMKPTCEPEQKRDLSFLKPSKRTSSQYVASAIAKYTGKPACNKVESIQEAHTVPEFSLSKQKTTGNRGISHRTETSNTKHTRTSSEIFQTQTRSTMLMVNPKRSLSFPDYTSEKSESVAEPKQDNGASTSSLGTNPPGRLYPTTRTFPQRLPVMPAQTPRSPTTRPGTTLTTPLHNLPPVQSGWDGMRPELARKPASLPAPGGPSEPEQVGPFGPVKKFKPVILRSVQREPSLHSSLMEEIQIGEGKERLKRIADAARESTLKTTSSVETENEHSALLSAIRAQNNSSRLRKVQSEAAAELEKCRKAELKTGPHRGKTPTISAPAPSPPPSFSAPPAPPPPPLFARSKPVHVLKGSGNPENTREAMLEAIRSGSGADRLKKSENRSLFSLKRSL